MRLSASLIVGIAALVMAIIADRVYLGVQDESLRVRVSNLEKVLDEVRVRQFHNEDRIENLERHE